MRNFLLAIKTFIAKTKVGGIVLTAITSLLSSNEISKALLEDTKSSANLAADQILACTDVDADVDIEVTGIKEVTITIKAKCKCK